MLSIVQAPQPPTLVAQSIPENERLTEFNENENDIEPDHFFEKDGVPVFMPTMDQFKDFYSFVKKIEKYGQKAGLAKIIPPKEWLDKNYTCPLKATTFRITNPISQNFDCGGLPGGAHRQLNMEKRASYSVSEWAHLCDSDEFAPPFLNYLGKMVRKEITKKRKRENVNTPVVVEEDEVTATENNIRPEINVLNTSHVIDEETISQMERYYWRNLSFQETMYGADLPGSLFTDDPENKWNVSSLESLLSTVNVPVPGVTTPYLYFGMYKATFAWHVEDMDLFSINYIHFGSPKVWYVIPPSQRSRFERFSSSLFFEEAKACTEFLRHKHCILSPLSVQQNHITVHRLVQNANEFVITFPAAYHQGFNTGFNCAESINFATPSWLEYGRTAKFCECVQDSVQMDVANIFGLEPVTVNKRGRKRPFPAPISVPPATLTALKKKAPLPKLPRPKCALCPLGHTFEFPLVPSDIPNVYAHVECGSFVFETWIEDIPVEGSEETKESATTNSSEYIPKKRVCGISKIPKDRWALKCSVCRYPAHIKNLGACIQCTRGKCVRAYHATCAILAGIKVTTDENNVLISLCSAHDPAKKEERKKAALELLAANAEEKFAPGVLIIARFASFNYEGVVFECLPEKSGCMVKFDDEKYHSVFAPWETLSVRVIPPPKVKPKPIYCTPPRKKKMKQLLGALLSEVPPAAPIFVDVTDRVENESIQKDF